MKLMSVLVRTAPSKDRVFLILEFSTIGDPSLCKCIRQVAIFHYKFLDTLRICLAFEQGCVTLTTDLFLVMKIQSTQIPGTATFLNRCGDITVLGRTSAMLERNSGLLKACLKCSADSQRT